MEGNHQNVVPRDMDSLSTKLKDIYGEDEPVPQKHKEIYLQNVNASERARLLIKNYPNHFDYIFPLLTRRVLIQEEVEVLAHNFQERQREKSKNEKDRYDRVISNPQATDEGYNLGIYSESIESQVRNAVFSLQKKGYLPIESGFLDVVEGSQYIGITIGEGVNPEAVQNSIINPDDIENVSVKVLRRHNKIHIILIPKDRKLSIEKWKIVWDKVAECIPNIKDIQGEKESDNGTQGVKFRETQNKIREGRNAWLNQNLAFVNGEVVPMSYQDFMNLEKSSK